jgi:hypothetical protein
MKLSDVQGETLDHFDIADDEAIAQAKGIVSGKASENVYMWSDSDTIEDRMNKPGDIARPARSQDLTGVYVREQITRAETKGISPPRAALETASVECAKQDLRTALAIAEEKFGYDETTGGAQDVVEIMSNDLKTADVEEDAKIVIEHEVCSYRDLLIWLLRPS